MTATVRRLSGVLVLAMLLALGSSVLATGTAVGSPRPVTAGSAPPPGTPSATVTIKGKNFAKFCVKNFKPHSTVTVKNERTGQTYTIHTNSKGSGCVNVRLKRNCAATTQTIVGTGTGADGKPARVSQTVTAPADTSLCAGSSTGPGGSTLPFTGADLAGIIIAGILLIAVGTTIVTVVRRRRADGSPA